MCLSGQPALKVRLAASSKRDGDEWAWVVNAAPAAAAVWAERTCEVAVNAAQNLQFTKLVFLLQAREVTAMVETTASNYYPAKLKTCRRAREPSQGSVRQRASQVSLHLTKSH